MQEYKRVSDFVDDYLLETADHHNVPNKTKLITYVTDYIGKLQRSVLEQCRHRIKLLPVTNYSAELPPDFHKMEEIAYKIGDINYDYASGVNQEIVDGVKRGCDFVVNVNCPQCLEEQKPCEGCAGSRIEIDIDSIWNEAYPKYSYFLKDFRVGTGTLLGSNSRYHNDFKLMKPTTSPFFNHKYYVPTCRNLGIPEADVQYKVDYPKIVVNFEKGYILLSYLGLRTDEDGLPMILGYPEVFEAVNLYLDEKLAWARWRRSVSPDDFKTHIAVRELRMRAQLAAKNVLQPFDIHEFWANYKKYWQNRVGRPYDKSLLK